ncbi:MAG TPA: ATPase domain-containing protein [Anaerolineae bacterium]|nr:ATPase domain-containing protein [Anaerolineae bacterium]
MNQPRVKTGIVGLDNMLRGGFLPGSIILVRGAPGAGKTSLALQFLMEGTRNNESGLFITFEEFPHSLYRDAESLGFDLQALTAAHKLQVVFTSPNVLLRSLQDIESPLYQTIVNANTSRAVIDSMTHFMRLTDAADELRRTCASIINSLRREGITSLLLGEEQRAEPRATDPGGLAYLSDGMILLRYVEVESEIHRAIVVLKLRGSDHAREIRRFTIQKGGLVVGEEFHHRSAILSGIARRN